MSPAFSFSTPTTVFIKHIHKNLEAVSNARFIIDESRIFNGSISDLQLQLSNDAGSTWVTQSENNVSVVFPSTTSTDILHGKIIGKKGVEIRIEDAIGKSFPAIQVRYNEAL